MRTYEQKIWWKRGLLLVAIGIGAFSLWYTHGLVEKLSKEEEKKIVVWANALKELNASMGENAFALSIIMNNESIPLIVTDENGSIVANRNLDSVKVEKDTGYLAEQLILMKAQHDPIRFQYIFDEATGQQLYYSIYYKDSYHLTRLREYPYYQLSVIALFILVSYFAFSSSRKAEQNRVWVGMSKETAHQLGTPISSVNGWIQLLRENTDPAQQEETLNELERDVKRLELITERFSKIGSEPALKEENVHEVLETAIGYLRTRTSRRVVFDLLPGDNIITARINIPLFEWVIENLCKNAIDAMNGEGRITVRYEEMADKVLIDIADTGKGIAPSRFKTVFKPGFTTKKRGWGLGLSLAKRIIEEYHKGKIFVRSSEPNKGTTFRIILKS